MSLTGGKKPNELIIEVADNDFMGTKRLKRYRRDNGESGGPFAMAAYVTFYATWNVGNLLKNKAPDALDWLAERGGYKAEPVYEPRKRGKDGLPIPIDGQARLILKNKDTALLFKLTFGGQI